MAANKSTGKQIDLSVIIVSYNTRDILDNCLAAINQQRTNIPLNFEVIVVDNGSTDGSGKMLVNKYPEVRLIQKQENLGFARANNAGIKSGSGRYILLLNSDTLISSDVFSPLVKFLDKNEKAGAVTCKLVLEDGRMDPACHRGFPTPINIISYLFKLEKLFPQSRVFGGYHLTYENLSEVHQIDCPSGAFFLIKRQILDRVGLLDEDFFMYAEDIDLAYRIKRSGFQIWFDPHYSVIHLKKQSGRSNTDKLKRLKTEIMFHENNKKFYLKHYRQKYPGSVNVFICMIFDIRIFMLKLLGI